jgi:chaperone required for assembly of F1-ATPase
VKETSEGFSVFLDTRQLKTPSGSLISLKSHLLTLAMANEWQSQKEFIKQFTMPLVI